jgi:hypothetical protein
MRIAESRLREVIRQVIRESFDVSVDRLPEDIDDDLLKELIYGMSAIFQSIDDEDIKDEIKHRANSTGYLSHLKSESGGVPIESYIDKINMCLGNNFVDQVGSSYTINKEAFKVLGFSNNDITRLCEYNSDSNTDDSYDYHTGVDVFVNKYDKIEFTLEH